MFGVWTFGSGAARALSHPPVYGHEVLEFLQPAHHELLDRKTMGLLAGPGCDVAVSSPFCGYLYHESLWELPWVEDDTQVVRYDPAVEPSTKHRL